MLRRECELKVLGRAREKDETSRMLRMDETHS